MERQRTFHCSVVTPERVVLECEARFAALPAHDGELGVLANRAPLVVKLGVGSLRIEAGGETHVFFVDGGFAQMADNHLSILTPQARRPGEIAPAAAEGALAAARAMAARDEAAFAERQRALARARAQLRLIRQ